MNRKIVLLLIVAAIFWERGLEFVGEYSIRFFDLKRMEGPDGATPLYNYMMNEYLNEQFVLDGKTNAMAVLAERKKYFPIPEIELSRYKDSGMVQNMGY